MQAQVIPFQFDANPIRTMLIDGQPWFVAGDVAAALEYAEAKDMTRNLDDDEKGRQIVPTPGGDQEMLVINESGLYSAILRSRKAEAKRFKKWVTAEVLPAIRKYGRYEDEQGRMPTLVSELIGMSELNVIKGTMRDKAKDVAPAKRRSFHAAMCSRLHTRFNVPRLEMIPADQFEAACNFVAAYALEGEWLPKANPVSPYHYPAEWLAEKNPQAPGLQIKERNGRRAVHLGQALMMTSSFSSPILDLIKIHKASGDNVEALELEIKAYRYIIKTQANILDDCADRFAAARLNTPFFSVA